MRVLVIGGGGREHAIVDACQRHGHEVMCTPGNPGIAVTFVDWEDLHKWALINRALEFGQPEPGRAGLREEANVLRILERDLRPMAHDVRLHRVPGPRSVRG